MTYYVGLDVSVESTAICVINDAGNIERELAAPSHPDEFVAALSQYSGEMGAIGLEAGPMSAFLAAGMKRVGLDVILMETRRAHAALSAIPGRSQWVAATHALNLSAGDSKSSVFLGRSFSSLATLLIWAWVNSDKSVPFGKYWRSRRLVFSFEPRCHGLCGSQK